MSANLGHDLANHKHKKTRLSIDCSTEDKLLIRASAKKAGKTISKYVLDIAKEKIREMHSAQSMDPGTETVRSFDDFWETMGYK